MRSKPIARARLDAFAKSSNSRAKARGNLAELSAADVGFAFKSFKRKCAYCSALATTLDHFIPIAKGGVSAAWNIVPACSPCNSKKGAVMPSDCVRLRFFSAAAIARATNYLMALAKPRAVSASIAH